MKYSVFTVMMPDCTPEQTVKLLQQEGYDGVEWRFTNNDPARQHEAPSFWGNNYSTIAADSTEEELKAVAQLMKEHGLTIPNLAAYIPEGDLAATEQAMKAAVILGAPSIRIPAPSYRSDNSYWQTLEAGRDYLAKVEKLSKQYGIKGAIETHHGNIACSASAARRLVEGFDPQHIGIIYDPGNMVHEGYETYRMGLEILGPYLAHVHVKNAAYQYNKQHSSWEVQWRTIDEGIVVWQKVIEDLKAIGYDEWLSIEDFSLARSTEQNLAYQIQYLKQIVHGK